MKLIKGHHKTFESTVKIENENGFSSWIHYEYYNEKRKED
jgi:hypothetical protein